MIKFVTIPHWVQNMYKDRIWEVETKEKQLFLTFDDGPHPSHSLFVLDELKKYNAKATFFCIGKNVAAYPDVYKRMIEDGHKVGNHSQDHLNAWKTPNDLYLENIAEARNYIHSNLFRPPYGKINSFLVKQLTNLYQLKTVMWSVLSYDFDQTISSERCLQNVLLNSKAGSVIVFHDSKKAEQNLKYVLPKTLAFLNENGYICSKID